MNKGDYLIIGKYRPPDEKGIGEIIERQWYGQGFIYKDDKAFYDGAINGAEQKVCYIPELSDTKYTHNDFLNLCRGQDDRAEELYEAVDWQSPGTLLDEWYADGDLDDCPVCGKMFQSYYARKCPYCGAPYKGLGVEE